MIQLCSTAHMTPTFSVETVALTALVTAPVSVLVATVVAYLVASRTAERNEVGKARFAARVAVAAAVGPRLAQLKRYRSLGGDEPERDPHTPDPDDWVFATDVLAAAAGLRPWRRRMVRYRLCRLVSSATVRVADDVPADTSTLGSFFAPKLVLEHRGRPPLSTTGLLHRALSSRRDSRTVTRAIRQLQRLKAAR